MSQTIQSKGTVRADEEDAENVEAEAVKDKACNTSARDC